MNKELDSFKIANEMICINDDLINDLSVTSFTNELTDEIRHEIDNMDDEQKTKVAKNLHAILCYCYKDKLNDNYLENLDFQNLNIIDSLGDEDLFYLLENVIYFLGRLNFYKDYNILREIYYLEDTFYLKFNAAFSAINFNIEEIELDFVNMILKDKNLAHKVISWTTVFFNKNYTGSPYNYVFSKDDDFSVPIKKRLKRLSQNTKKAYNFRLLDLVVLSLFAKECGSNIFDDKDFEVINNTDINYDMYSKEKVNLMKNIISSLNVMRDFRIHLSKLDIDTINILNNFYSDDISDFIKAEFSSLKEDDCKKMQNVLQILYFTIINNETESKYQKEKEYFSNLNELQKLTIKDQIFYYIGRIPYIDNSSFYTDAYYKEDDIRIRRSIAVGGTLFNCYNIERDYINSMIKLNSLEDICNRSATEVFYQDVDANFYTNTDIPSNPWYNCLKERLQRLNITDSNNPKFKKAESFRLFDIGTIYTFIATRDYKTILTDE